MSDANKGLWAKCPKCAHCRIVAYYPMNLAAIGKIIKANSKLCPKCGARKPVVAKQDNGQLLETTP